MDTNLKDQLIGSVADEFNRVRILDNIKELTKQDFAFLQANEQIDKIREFVGTPEHILGSDLTKHGEIAEQVEVGIHNARQAINQEEMTATFEGVGRTAPEDYLVNDIQVQSKFINGINNNLDHVIDNMGKYDYFGRDGSYYHIPNDTYNTIDKILLGEDVGDLSQRTINAVKEKVQIIEQETGKSFREVVRPAISDYREVQQGKVHETLDEHEKDIYKKNEEIKKDINQAHQPSLQEGLKVAGISAIVGGVISLTTGFYRKYREGKRFYKGEFSADDWKEVLGDAAKGSAVGSITGASIYALTNYAFLSAPFAAAIVSATKGIGSLVKNYKLKQINKQEFLELGMIVCAESAVVACATTAGQILIPIPILGAVIGSLAGSLFVQVTGKENKNTVNKFIKQVDDYIKKVEKSKREIIQEINTKFTELGQLTKAAFSIENNKMLLELSINLAYMCGVEDSKIMKSNSAVDSFING